jgi:hypothetical protein
MHTELPEVRGHSAAPDDDVVVVHLDSRLPQPVEISVARPPLGLELEAHDERRWIDQRAQPSARGSVLGYSGSNFRRLDA